MADAATERGRPLPQFILDEPEISVPERFYLHAFNELSTCRPLGMGCVGPIPWLAMAEYADRSELDPEVRRAFMVVVRSMDSDGYLPWQASEAERNRKKPGGK